MGIGSYGIKPNRLVVPKNTLSLFERTPRGKLAGFFRLHDSGDLFHVRYIEAWTLVAKTMPAVYIWIPTRFWIRSADPVPVDDLRGTNLTWYEAWMDGSIKGSTLWKMRTTGSAARRRGSRSRVVGAPNTVSQQSPGAAGLAEWYLDKDCGKTVLPMDPTRGQGLAMRELAALPNVALRPSGLYIKEYPDDPVTIPVIEGLAAGSGVVRKYNPFAYEKLNEFRQKVTSGWGQRRTSSQVRDQLARVQKAFKKQDKIRILKARSRTADSLSGPQRIRRGNDAKRILKYAQLSTMQVGGVPAQEAYKCPVYTENAKGVEAKSCRDAECRACWILPQLPIFYGAH